MAKCVFFSKEPPDAVFCAVAILFGVCVLRSITGIIVWVCYRRLGRKNIKTFLRTPPSCPIARPRKSSTSSQRLDTWQQDAMMWGAMSEDERVRRAVDQLEEIHPGGYPSSIMHIQHVPRVCSTSCRSMIPSSTCTVPRQELPTSRAGRHKYTGIRYTSKTTYEASIKVGVHRKIYDRVP